MKRPIRTLFYGVTHEHAEGKFATLLRMPETFEIVGIVDDRPRGTGFYVDTQLEPAGYRIVSEEDAFTIPDIEAVFVETTNADLMRVAQECAKRGIPMHCDKPCGPCMEPYASVVETCRRGNIPMQIGYMYRANPAVQFALRAVRAGWLGDIVFVEADMNHDYGKDGYADYISSFPGGILYNLGCHLVDMVAPMLDGLPVRVTADIGDAPGDPEGSRTRAAAFLQWPTADVLIRTSSRAPGSLPCRRLRVDGTNGTIDLCPIERFDGQNLKLQMTLARPAGGYAPGCHTIDFGALSDRYADQLREFAQIVRGEIPNDPGAYDRDLRVHQIHLMMCETKGDMS
jgi:predicted dehydrogenase